MIRRGRMHNYETIKTVVLCSFVCMFEFNLKNLNNLFIDRKQIQGHVLCSVSLETTESEEHRYAVTKYYAWNE